MQELLEKHIKNSEKHELEALLTAAPELALQTTSAGLSPLLLACYLKKPDLADLILKHVPEPDLFEAIALGRFDLMAHELFKNPESINIPSKNGFTALGLAVYFGHEDITRYLLLKGAEVNLPSKNQSIYPLHSAVAAKFNMLAKMLLEAGADVNVTQHSGLTPLHTAAEQGNIELIILLLEAGADVKAKTANGHTPGDLALKKGLTEIARILND